MTCPFASQVDDYVDAALSPAPLAAFEAHLRTCASCGPLVEDLRAIRVAAAGLERHAPPARLWARIDAGAQTRSAAAVGGSRWWQVPGFGYSRWAPVMAGAVVFMLIAGGWVAWHGRGPADAPATARVANADPAQVTASVETELALAEGHYDRAIAGLEQITSAEGSAIDPQTSAVLQTNLSVIDQAIGESRAALTVQPQSLVAQESLFEALRSKVTLLQDTVALINEMRKGDQDGAARIISGLNQ